jgi:hypothetical protein
MTLKSKTMHWYNIWKWPIEIYEDIRQWRMVNSALKEGETIAAFKSYKYELRVDKLGRIYTVINVPEELWPYEKQDQVWPWMVEQLRELDIILMERNLNELVFPEVTRIEDAPAYLVVLTPSTESFQLTKLFSWLFRLGFTTITYVLLNKICLKAFGLSIIDSLISLFS